MYMHIYCHYAKFHNEGNEFRDDIKLMFKNLSNALHVIKEQL